MLMDIETLNISKKNNGNNTLKNNPKKKAKKLTIYSDYAYFGKIKDKLILVKEKPNFKSLIKFGEETFLFHNIKDNKQKYKESDFDKDTLQKIKELNEEKRKLLFNKYFEENPTEGVEDLKQIRKIYTHKYRRKEHI